MPWSNNPKQNVWEEYSFYIAATNPREKGQLLQKTTSDLICVQSSLLTASNGLPLRGFSYHGASMLSGEPWVYNRLLVKLQREILER